MGSHFLPTPSALHNRSTFGQAEKPIEELPFYSVVAAYLQNSMGEGFTAIQLSGGETRELAVITINDESFYEQSLGVAQHLWDMGYVVLYNRSRIPGRVGVAATGPTEMYICWGSDVIKKRTLPCPCWSCPMSFKEKLECQGCDKYTVYASGPRRPKGGV